MFKINRGQSHKLIKTIKIITFASILGIVNPVVSEAKGTDEMIEKIANFEEKHANKIRIGLIAIPSLYIFIDDIVVCKKEELEKEKVKKKDSE